MSSETYSKPSDSCRLDRQTTKSSLLAVAATGLGKAQPWYSKVLTNHGWVQMWEIDRLGLKTLIVGSDGGFKELLAVYDQGERECYRVSFNDGTKVDCCGEHLWAVQTKSSKKRQLGYKVKQTLDLINDLRDGSGSNKWFVPIVEPIQFESQELPIDPYVVGALLGDGGTTNHFMFSSGDDFIIDQIRNNLPKHYDIEQVSKYDWRVTVGVNEGWGVGSILRQVLGRKLAHEKEIPMQYLFASVDQRISLLQGLMDTDGTVAKDGHCEFNTTSSRLADDVCELVRSLGGVTRVRTKPGSWFTHKGIRKRGRVSYRVTVNLDCCVPFRLPRKISRVKESRKQGRTKAIIEIQPIGKIDCRCIRVDSPDCLYVTEGHTLTHNTVLMSGLAKHWPIGRVMMISHRYELNAQAIRTFEDMCGEEVALEQASYFADRGYRSRIVVASVQTLNSRNRGKYRMERFDPFEFGLLMIDEAHRAAAPSYRRVVQYFQQNPELKVIGVTATPDRLDGVGMGCVFEDTICDLNILWGVQNGWLVSPRQVLIEIESLDLSEVKTVGGDLDNGQLAKIMEAESNLHSMAKPIVDYAGKENQSIVFAASVAHAQRLAELIRDYYFRLHGSVSADTAVAIDGSMNPQDPRRLDIVRRFKSGEIQFLCNCGVATEGFDAPNVRLVAIGRPTKSRALYTQMVGRGTRPLPGTVESYLDADSRINAIRDSNKPACTVLDFIGQSGRHSLVCTTDILAGSEPKEVTDRANSISSQRDFSGSTMDALRLAKEQIAIEREARRKQVTVGVNYRSKESDSVSRSVVDPLKLVRPGLVSEKQARFLLKLGFTQAEIESVKNRGHLQRLFDEACTKPRNGTAIWFRDQQRAKAEGSL